MSERAPPFSALRAVEAASRHKSFTWAAKELQITHSAVSQSIRRLEANLGTPLFARKGGAMEPSEAALRLAQSYSEAAQSLGATIRAITGDVHCTRLSVGMPASFGRLWFAGKLARLGEAVPDLRVEVATSAQPEQEVQILFAAEPQPSDQILSGLSLFPVINPKVASRGRTGVEQILEGPLLAERQFPWAQWAARHDRRGTVLKAHVFDDAEMMLSAAAHGEGFALTHALAAEGHVAGGQLVALPFLAVTGDKLVFRSRAPRAKSEIVDRLYMWLKLEVGRSVAQLRGRTL